MQKLKLIRLKTNDHGTFGVLVSDDGRFMCWTLELPWRNNQANISCIPTGKYEAQRKHSPRFNKPLYRLNDSQTAPRSAILIHAGNYAGDTKKGFKSDAQGCILLGGELATRNLSGLKQEMILNSQYVMENFHNHMQGEDLELTILEAFDD